MDEDISVFKILGWITTIFFVLFFVYGCGVVFNIVSLPFSATNGAIQSGKGVIRQITDPTAMLNNYRWFKDAHYRLQTFPAQIAAAKRNLAYAEQHTPNYVANRMTEYTGIQQVCLDLVGQYNSRAERMDSGFLRNPEQWLPVASTNYTPLPETYNPDFCTGDQK